MTLHSFVARASCPMPHAHSCASAHVLARSASLPGPSVSVFALLEALVAVGLPEALQDEVAGAMGDAAEIALAHVKDLLVGAGVGLAAAKRIVGQLSRPRP